MSDHKYKISVIIPVFNSETTLKRALESCLAQTLADWEVIAVDDASTDRSPAILHEMSELNPRIRVIRQKQNSGTLSARRIGVEAAQGKYLMFLDPDDTFLSESMETLYNIAEKEKADMVNFGLREWIGEGDSARQVWNWVNPPPGTVEGEGAVLRDLLKDKGHYWSLCLKLIKAELGKIALQETDDFYCIMGEDFYFYLPIAYHAKKMVKTELNLYDYYVAEGVTSCPHLSLDRFRKTATVLDAMNAIERYLKEHNIHSEYKNEFEQIEREQYLILWNKWYQRLEQEDQAEAVRYLISHAGAPDRLVRTVFDENDYLRQNEEFLKFARRIYGVMNRFFPKDSWMRLKLKAWYKKKRGH